MKCQECDLAFHPVLSNTNKQHETTKMTYRAIFERDCDVFSELIELDGIVAKSATHVLVKMKFVRPSALSR